MQSLRRHGSEGKKTLYDTLYTYGFKGMRTLTPRDSGQQTRRPFHVDLGTPVPDVEPRRGAREGGRDLE